MSPLLGLILGSPFATIIAPPPQRTHHGETLSFSLRGLSFNYFHGRRSAAADDLHESFNYIIKGNPCGFPL